MDSEDWQAPPTSEQRHAPEARPDKRQQQQQPHMLCGAHLTRWLLTATLTTLLMSAAPASGSGPPLTGPAPNWCSTPSNQPPPLPLLPRLLAAAARCAAIMPDSSCFSSAICCCCCWPPLPLPPLLAASWRVASICCARPGGRMPQSAAMAAPVAALSPVIMRTAMPARWQSRMAPGTSVRTVCGQIYMAGTHRQAGSRGRQLAECEQEGLWAGQQDSM